MASRRCISRLAALGTRRWVSNWSGSKLIGVASSSLSASSSCHGVGFPPPWRSHSVRRLQIDASRASDHLVVNALLGSDAGVVVLTLNRPDARNAIGVDMLKQLQAALDNLKHSSMARVVLVCSIVPGVFCAGADLKERRKMSVHEARVFVNGLRSAFSSLEVLPQPTIAVVEGAALGGGVELALACDLRVCGAEATFGLPETGLAIIPGAGGTQRLPRLVGKSRAKELVFTGRRIDADEAESYGLVEYSALAGNAYDKAMEIARKILKQGPLAVRMAKLAIDRGSEVDASSGMVIEEACYGQLLNSKDRLEGLAAFAEKRIPVYRGE